MRAAIAARVVWPGEGEGRGFVLPDRLGEALRDRDATALDPDEDEAVRASVLLDDLVGDADDRPADLLGGHDPAPAHRRPPATPAPARRFVARLRRGTVLSSPFRPHGARSRLSWPVAKVDAESTRSVDPDGHPGRPGPPAAAADPEEVGPVHVDDTRRLDRAVVVDDTLEPAVVPADHD